MGDSTEGAATDAESTPETACSAVGAATLRARQRLGSTVREKWRLDSLLGVGEIAAVYAATSSSGSRGAVKVLHAGMLGNPFVRPQCLWEGFVANVVDHPGAVKVVEDGETDDGSPFQVTELYDGETLEELRTRLGGRLTCEEVLLVTNQVLSVLAAAHARRLLHGDLKPQNLLLTRSGEIKVMDFGVAQLHQPVSGPGESGVTVAGTPAHMPPEQAHGRSNAVDERSDLWGCGATMFCLLSGRAVNEGVTVDERLNSAKSRPAPLLKSVAPDVDARVARFVDRALERSKDRRWQNAASMQEALRDVYQAVSGHSIVDAPTLVFERNSADTSEPSAGKAARSLRPVGSTAGAMALSQTRSWQFRSRARKGVTVGGAVLIGLLLVGAVERLSGGHTEGRAQATAGPLPVKLLDVNPQQTAEVVTPLPPSPTATLLSDLSVDPVATTSASRRPALAATASAVPIMRTPAMRAPAITQAGPITQAAPVTQASAAQVPIAPPSVAQDRVAPPAGSQSACTPPYVVDLSTGKKRWKLECL